MKPFPLILLIFSMSMSAQDWPNLSKYHQGNKDLGTPAPDEHRIVFMGNSITEGWSVSNPDFFKGKPYINRGISGQTTPQMVLRFRQDVINLKPKIVLILAGTNDIAGNTGPMTLEQIHDNILSMVQLAKANGIHPIVCSVLPAYDYPWKPGLQPNIKIPRLNRMLQHTANKENVMYLDYFSALKDHRNGLSEEFAEDGVHPTPKAYAIMEVLVTDAIEKLLAEIEGQ